MERIITDGSSIVFTIKGLASTATPRRRGER
jgi:hypothetical protein